MNWNASLPIWSVGVFIVVPLGLLALAAGKLYWNECLTCEIVEDKLGKVTDERTVARAERDNLNRESAALHTQNEDLITRNADLHDALDDAQKEIKALKMNTIQMPEIATQAPIPLRPKRLVKKKVGSE